MELTVLIEQSADGYRASTGGPFDLIASGPTADAAAEALQKLIAARLRDGQLRTLNLTGAKPILDAARAVGQNPVFEDWIREIDEYRRVNNIPADAE